MPTISYDMSPTHTCRPNGPSVHPSHRGDPLSVQAELVHAGAEQPRRMSIRRVRLGFGDHDRALVALAQAVPVARLCDARLDALRSHVNVPHPLD